MFSVFGDARREDVLKQAMVERASKVIVATDADDTTVLITLSVHRLNSGPPSSLRPASRATQTSSGLAARLRWYRPPSRQAN